MMFSTCLLGALTFASSSIAANVVSLDFSKTQIAGPQYGHSAKRSTVPVNLTNSGTFYWAEVHVGTPPQKMRLLVDTGSTDTWVMTNITGKYCSNAFDLTCSGSFFTPNDSSTYAELNIESFFIEYGDHTTASGPFFVDDLMIGDASIKLQQMGLGVYTDSTSGILGLSYDTNEYGTNSPSTTTSEKSPVYPSVMDQLVKQDILNAPVYSLWLDDLNATTGTILFGGVDVEKFTGELLSTPVLADPYVANSTYQAFNVSLNYIGFNGLALAYLALPVILDSGTSDIYLPGYLVDRIVSAYGAEVDPFGYYIVDCDTASKHPNDNLEFAFGGQPNATTNTAGGSPRIRVPLSELIVDADTGLKPVSSTTECQLAIFDTIPEDGAILGDTFLRSAYVVYDLKNNQIGLAQAYFNSTESSIVEIEANATGIPALCGKNGPCSTTGKYGNTSAREGEKSAAANINKPVSGVFASLAVVLFACAIL